MTRVLKPDGPKIMGRTAYMKEYHATHPAKRRLVSKEYRRAEYRLHRERYLARAAAYRLAHPEQVREKEARKDARRRGAPECDHLACRALGPLELAWQTNEHRCYMCGVPVSRQVARGLPGHAHMDHVIPLAKGGIHCAENIRPSCPTCNHRKGGRVLQGAVA